MMRQINSGSIDVVPMAFGGWQINIVIITTGNGRVRKSI